MGSNHLLYIQISEIKIQRQRFPKKKPAVEFVSTPICYTRGSCFTYVICIYVLILVSSTNSISDSVCVNSNTTAVTSGVERTVFTTVAPEFSPSKELFSLP